MEEDGFKLVATKRARKAKTINGNSKQPIILQGTLEDVEKAMKRTKEAWEKCQFSKRFLEIISHNVLLDGKLKLTAGVPLIFQDPTLTEPEREWLTARGYGIRDRLDTEIDFSTLNPGEIALVVMIHAPHEIRAELLSFNWSREALSKNRSCREFLLG
ncbi:unnamed protein product [Caenorhabditis auriculariae]|uniref:SRR1-like domain-containing protein n=1 Tax=Caenorhabditis auriculariae TaxID=2777116 RepID=A0A8S1HVV5_9PELO|nr:unnamed protein product [Caenorhabditis auriculariae]